MPTKPRPDPARPAWVKLGELAEETRSRRDDQAGEVTGDWEPGDITAAVLAVETAGWTFRRAAAEVLRMLFDPDARPDDLRRAVIPLARQEPAPGPGLTREEREELRAQAVASCEAATERSKRRETGPMPRLAEDTPPGAARTETR